MKGSSKGRYDQTFAGEGAFGAAKLKRRLHRFI